MAITAESHQKWLNDRELIKAKILLGDTTVDENYINQFSTNASKFLTDSANDYSNIKWGQSQAALNAYNNEATKLKYQKVLIEDWLSKNAEKGSYNELQEWLNSVGTGLNDIGNSYRALNDSMSGFKTADEYNAAVTRSKYADSTYDEILAEITRLGEEQKNQTPETAAETQKQRDVLNGLLYSSEYTDKASYDKAISDLDRQIAAVQSELDSIQDKRPLGNIISSVYDVENQSKTSELEKRLKQLKAQKTELGRKRNTLETGESLRQYGTVQDIPEFPEYSQKGSQMYTVDTSGTLKDIAESYEQERNKEGFNDQNLAAMFWNIVEKYPKLLEKGVSVYDLDNNIAPNTARNFDGFIKQMRGEIDVGGDGGLGFMADEDDYVFAQISVMNDTEKAIYNYLFAMNGIDTANDYLTKLSSVFYSDNLNKRKGEKDYAEIEGNTLKEILYGIESGLDQWEQGTLTWLGGNDSDYATASASQYTSQLARERLNDWGFKLPEWLGGASFGQVLFDLGNTTANMMPSVVASIALGAINPTLGKIAGAGMIGASASGNAYNEMISLGYDKNQSKTYATLVGVSEAGLQYLLGGISKFGGKLTGTGITKLAAKFDSTFAKFAIKLGGSMASEGLEEYLQEVLTPLFKNYAFDTDEKINLLSPDALYAGILGALSGGLFEGYDSYKSAVAEASVQELIKTGSNMSPDSEAYRIAQELSDTPISKLKEDQINSLVDAVRNESIKSRHELANRIENYLVEFGETGDTNKIAWAIVDFVSGVKLSQTEQNLIKSSTAYKSVINELKGVSANQSTDSASESNVNSTVDSVAENGYNSERGENYVRTDEFRRLQAESQRMSDEEIQLYHSGEREVNEELRKNISGILRSQIDAARNGVRNDYGILNLSAKGNQFNLYENVNGNLFHDCFDIARNYLKNGELVDLHSVNTTDEGIGYKDCFNYLSEDGLSGFSITPDGDLISVFNASGKPGFLNAIAPIVKEKAKTLDCYNSSNQPLMGIYSKVFGFKTASVMDYNMEYDHDNIAENHGNPQVAFMVNTDAEVETKHFTKDQYDEAKEYRDGFVKSESADSSESASFMPENESVLPDLSAEDGETDENVDADIQYTDDEVVDSFDITDINDYVHVQKQVISTLKSESFFTDEGGTSTTVTNANSGMVVEVNTGSMREAFNDKNFKRVSKTLKIAKLATIRDIPALIKKGTLIDDNVENTHKPKSNVKYAYIENNVLINGKPATIKIAIRKSPRKNKFWVHTIDIKNTDGSLLTRTENGSEVSYQTSVDEDSVPQDEKIVKENAEETEQDADVDNDSYAKDESFWKADNKNDDTSVSKTLKERLAALFGIKDDSDKPVSIGEIVQLIEKEFSVPISTGRFKQKAYGIYKNKSKAIRTKVSNALPTIAHELGHHLDHRYGLRNFESISEAIRVLKEQRPDFAAAYNENQLPGEAVAEFLRYYLADRRLAQEMYPSFFEEFERRLPEMAAQTRNGTVNGADDLAKLKAIGDKINRYFTAEKADAARAAVITRTEAKRRERTGIRLSDILEKAVAQLADKAVSLKKISREAYDLYTYSLKSAVRAKNSLEGSYLTGLDGAPLTVKGDEYKAITDDEGRVLALKDIVGVFKTDVETNDFRMYLIYKHGVEWVDSGKRVFADDVLNNKGFMLERIKEYETEYPNFKAVAENVYLWQRAFMQEYAVKSGLVTEQQMKALNEKYPCYIPFYRYVEKKTSGVKSSIGNQKSLILRAKGSGLELFDPFENIGIQVERWMKAADRNAVMQEIAKVADTEEGLGYLIEKVDPKMVPNSVSTQLARDEFAIAVKELLDKDSNITSEQKANAAKAIMEEFDGTVGESITDFRIATYQGENYVSVMNKGKMSVYQIHDVNLLTAVIGMKEANFGAVSKMFGTMTRTMKALTTGVNAVWSITSNSVRDIQSAFLYTGEKNPISFTKDYFKAVGYVLKAGFGKNPNEIMKLYRTAGGGYNNSLSSDLKTVRATMKNVFQQETFKNKLKRWFNLIEQIEKISDAIESAPRVAEFKRVYEKTGDYKKAIIAAEEITVNFNRSGAFGKNVDQFIPYFNAGVQGLNKLVTTLKNENGNRQAFFAKTAICAVITTALEFAFMHINGDDGEEEYEKLSPYKKNNFYNIYLGDGMFLSIPKAKELGVFASFLERTVEISIKDDVDFKQEFDDLAGYVFDMFIPPLLDEAIIFSTMSDLRANEDYKGSPIVPTYYEGLEAADQYNEKTSYMARFLGDLFDYSPMKIDYIINSNLGIIGTINQSFFSPEGDWSMGVKTKFSTDSAYSTDVFNNFYKHAEDASQKANSHPDDAEAIYRNKQYSAVKSIISALNQYGKDLGLEREYKIYARDYVDDFEKNSEIDERLVKLLERTGDKDILYDKTFSATYSIDGKKYTIPADDYLNYVEEYYTLVQKEYDEILSYGYSDERTVAMLKKSKSHVEKILKTKYKTGE